MNGVAKLEECNEKVTSLKEELEKLKPNLILKTELAEKIMKVKIFSSYFYFYKNLKKNIIIDKNINQKIIFYFKIKK